ncbi:hypothetical protein AB6O49_30210 [Streptomyces sp. SBR177]
MQQVNGTARPEPGVHHFTIFGLNDFTKPVRFRREAQLIALGREDLEGWAYGAHLYDAIRAGVTSQ